MRIEFYKHLKYEASTRAKSALHKLERIGEIR